jgi:hypothetical protein
MDDTKRAQNHHHSWPTSVCEPENVTEPRIKRKPFFTNHCQHKDTEFVGAAEYWQGAGKQKQIDVYIHGDDQEVCIRYGEEGSEYITAGTVCDLLTSCGAHNDGAYCVARSIIDEMCVIRTTRREV